MEIYLILFIVVVIYKFAVAGYGQLAGLGFIIGDLCCPYLIGSVLGNIIGHFGFDAFVFRGDNGVSGTVAAFAFEAVQGFAHGRP